MKVDKQPKVSTFWTITLLIALLGLFSPGLAIGAMIFWLLYVAYANDGLY